MGRVSPDRYRPGAEVSTVTGRYMIPEKFTFRWNLTATNKLLNAPVWDACVEPSKKSKFGLGEVRKVNFAEQLKTGVS